MLKRHFAFLLAATCAAVTTWAQSGSLRAGAARVDITPPADEFPFPLVPSGRMPSFVGVHDPLCDLLGTAAQLIEKQSPNAPVVLFASGADGDQRPIFRSTPVAVGKLPSIPEGAAAWDMVDVLGSVLAKAVLGLTDGMQPGTGDVKLSAAAKTVTCPTQKQPSGQTTGKAATEDGPPAQIPLNLIRIGDIAVAGVGGNIGSVIGQKFKAASPFAQSTMLTVTSGSVGYVLDDASYANPGKIKTGLLKPGCAENAIVQGLLEMIKAKP